MLIAILTLSGCTEANYEEKHFNAMPAELKDCKVYRLDSGGSNGTAITVMRCPNSTTATNFRAGKTTATAIVVDGVEYTPKQPAKEESK